MRETMSVDACYVIFTLCKLSSSPADSGHIVLLIYEVVVELLGHLGTGVSIDVNPGNAFKANLR